MRESWTSNEIERFEYVQMTAKLNEIVKVTKKDPKCTTALLWKEGPAVLNLRHPALDQVYCEEDIEQIEAEAEEGSQQVKNKKVGKQERTKKRQRQSTTEECSEPEYDDQDTAESTNGSSTTSSKECSAAPRKESSEKPQSTKKGHSKRIKLIMSQSSTREEQAYTDTRGAVDQENDASEDEIAASEGTIELDLTELPTTRCQADPISISSDSRRPTRDRTSGSIDSSLSSPPPELLEDPMFVGSHMNEIPDSTQQIAIAAVSVHHHPSRSTDSRATSGAIKQLFDDIKAAVSNYMGDLGLNTDAIYVPQLRTWSDDLRGLMKEVFGLYTDEESLIRDLSNVHPRRSLPSAYVLRTLIAAAVNNWAFKPSPLGSTCDIPSQSRDGRALRFLLEEIEEEPNLGQAVAKQLKHKATQRAINELRDEDLPRRVPALARDLFLALKPLLDQVESKYNATVKNTNDLMPLPEDTPVDGRPPPDQPPLPPIGSIQHESEAAFRPFPGTARFEEALRDIFQAAFDLRFGWEQGRDAQYEFDFPSFRHRFNERTHYNIEYREDPNQPDATGRPKRVPTDMRSRVFICLTPGIRMSIRRSYDEDYGEWCLVSRAAVFMLE